VSELPYFVVDHGTNTVYIYIADEDTEITSTRGITDNINADFDADGNVVGVEFLSLKMDFGREFEIRKVTK